MKNVIYRDDPTMFPFPGIDPKIIKLTKKLKTIYSEEKVLLLKKKIKTLTSNLKAFYRKKKSVEEEILKKQSNCSHVYYCTGHFPNHTEFICVCGHKLKV